MTEQIGTAKQPSEQALQARINLHQNILREYRVRGYQLVLAHMSLALLAGKYGGDQSVSECVGVVAGVTVVTVFLFAWLRRLRDKSDGHRDDAMALYKKLGVALDRDTSHKHSQYRLWTPMVSFPWVALASLVVWLAGAKWPELLAHA